MASLHFGRVHGPLGPMWVAETDAGVAAVTRADSPVEWLAALGYRLVGLDSPSVDAFDSTELPCHHALRRVKMVNLELLRLIERLSSRLGADAVLRKTVSMLR